MSYMGQTWRNKELPKSLNFGKTALVLVTGSTPNTCGHVLLYIGGGIGHYYHFNGPGLWDYPRYLESNSAYERFLRDEGKRELIRKFVSVPHPEKAKARLFELMNGRWFTFIGAHNCGSFAGEILHAGGNFHTMPQHCPVFDIGLSQFWERIFGPLREKLGTQKQYEASHVR